jgi:hypothetical protein
MGSIAKVVVSAAAATVVGLWVFACNNGNVVVQGVVAANVQPGTGSCLGQGEEVWIPQNGTVAATSSGPDTANNSNVTQTGTSDDMLTCTVVPSSTPNQYAVTLVAQITGGTTPGTVTITGTFTSRGRETVDEAGTPNADQTQIPNITMDFLDATKHLKQTNCFAQYTTVTGVATPGASLPGQADTFADNSGGRIWASVFCSSPTNLLESQKPGNAGCAISATFRFENCSSKAN